MPVKRWGIVLLAGGLLAFATTCLTASIIHRLRIGEDIFYGATFIIWGLSIIAYGAGEEDF